MWTRLGITVGLLVLLAFGAWRLSKSRTFQLYGGLVTRVETDQPVVALTFDDGPTPQGTDAILPVLDSLGVRATFFVTGREMEANPEHGRRLVEAGHVLGNHSYSHERMVLKTPGWVRREIETTDQSIREAGWDGPILFRPPYGARLVTLPRYLRQTGRETIYWDLEPESYAEVRETPEAIARHVVEGARPGSIVLLHVMYRANQTSREAVPLIVDGLRARGFRFVTVPGLLAEREAAGA
ncbi:MAG: polysaccharide deacetylase family protein [Bacteroidota bacterium]